MVSFFLFRNLYALKLFINCLAVFLSPLNLAGGAPFQSPFAGFNLFLLVVIRAIPHRCHVYLGGQVGPNYQGEVLEGFFVIHGLVGSGDCHNPLDDGFYVFGCWGGFCHLEDSWYF